jgi:hypothetical protein
MQIFSFCMAASKTINYNVFSKNYGAPEEIRTPDPQTRSLVPYPKPATGQGSLAHHSSRETTSGVISNNNSRRQTMLRAPL